ncbi:MAG: hypothetical protein WC596_00140 [Candidatus Shapirobacteria bacterium]
MKLKFLLTFNFITLLTFYFPPAFVYAQHFSSDTYIIDWGNFNVTSGRKASTNYQLTDTVGQNAPGLFSKNGYVVKSGFQYIHDTFFNFSFSLENQKLAIDFGSLTPDIGTTDSNIISVSSPSGHGYEILAHQNHPLMAIGHGLTIPDTPCNVGSTCTESVSGTWTTSTVYGFGFNTIGINTSNTVTGVGTSNYFDNSGNQFRQFADYSRSENPQIIMSENSPAKNRRARITYKVNISGVQPAGSYQNAITFTAVPKY